MYETLKGKKNWQEFETLLSPVTTITRMPAVIQESIAFFTSSRGGSSIPTYTRGEKEHKKKVITYWKNVNIGKAEQNQKSTPSKLKYKQD